MTLVKRNFPVIHSMNDFFDDDWLKWRSSEWIPAVNIAENENSYEIELAVPGMKKENFNVELEGDILTVTGEVETTEEEKKRNYTRKEFNFRSFKRNFTLPENVIKEGINAKYVDGMLKLELKKSVKEVPARKTVKIL